MNRQKAGIRTDWEPFNSGLGLVRLILLVDWDPIGVFGHPRTMNEYDSYAPHIHHLLGTNADVRQIANSLYEMETINMGMQGNRERTAKVAERLKHVYDRHES